MKKKTIIILLFLSVLLTYISMAVYAANDNKYKAIPEENLPIENDSVKNFNSAKSAMPDIDRIYDSEQNSYKYITIYKDQFGLDYEESWYALDSDVLYNANTDVMFAIQQSLVEIVIFLVDKVYNFKVYSLFKGLVKNIVSNMYSANANILISIILSMLGIYFAYKMIKNQKSEFLSTIVKTIIIITIGLLFFNKPNLILNKLDFVFNNISNEILDMKSSFSIAEDKSEEEGSTEIANFMWEQYILKPWQFLEFGDMETAEKYTDEILAKDPGTDGRVEKLNEIFEKESIDTYGMATYRLAFICMYYIPLIISLVMISLISILILGYQFLAIVVFLFGVFVMILALLPNGTNLLKIWASKLFGFAAMKVFLTFLFTILISVNEVLFDNVKNQGWIAVLALQVLFYIMIFIKRNSLISMFVSLQSELTNPYMALNKLRTIRDLPYMQAYSRNHSVETVPKKSPTNYRYTSPNYRYNIHQIFNKNIPQKEENNIQKPSTIDKHIRANTASSNKLQKHRIKPEQPLKENFSSDNKTSLKPLAGIKPLSKSDNSIKNSNNLNLSSTTQNNNNSDNHANTDINEENNNFNIKNHIKKLKTPPKNSIRRSSRYRNFNTGRNKKND